MSLTNDIDLLRNCHGFFIGLLDDSELAAFRRLQEDGIAREVWSDSMYALLGMTKVHIDYEAAYAKIAAQE